MHLANQREVCSTSLPVAGDERIAAPERPDITVIVVNYNTAHLLDRLFASLEAGRGALKVQLIVVDNASRDGSADILRTRFADVELIENSTNVGFGRANNQACERVRGRYVLLLNSDAFVAPDTLAKTLKFMETHPRCGVLGVKLVGEDGSLQPSCRYFPTPWNAFLSSIGLFHGARLIDDNSSNHASIRECDWVPGCYYLIRREVIDQIGLFDPRFFFYCEEVDHCRRVRQAGWNVVCYTQTHVVHIGGESATKENTLVQGAREISDLRIESELLYFRKHYGLSGVLASVFLTALADTMKACSGLIRRRNVVFALARTRHTWTMLRLLFRTRLASRPTR